MLDSDSGVHSPKTPGSPVNPESPQRDVGIESSGGVAHNVLSAESMEVLEAVSPPAVEGSSSESKETLSGFLRKGQGKGPAKQSNLNQKK